MRHTTEFVGLCDHCGIERGEAWESERPCFNSPGEWSARCLECGGEEITCLEEIVGVKSDSVLEDLADTYYDLKESDDYEDRLRAEGFIKALEVLI